MAAEEFDGMLMNIAERKRGIEPMLDTVFGFLRRRTDFFKGKASSKVHVQHSTNDKRRLPEAGAQALRGGVCVRVAFQGFIRACFATCKLQVAGLTTAISCG